MNPAEKIQAAIDKLEGLRDQGWPGKWQYVNGAIETDEGFELFQHHDAEYWGTGRVALDVDHAVPQAELIVTLHRTIDAQLAILHRGISDAAPEREVAELLADAILGDSDA
ncbi:hypothetical protein [Agromyces sp. NBRC 114283]|uniref:hypothetical protein n=1 Tax=Agromyces sp. NBRC 114283 TaxID=2994521 RepID=UPI0024A0D2F9|nr:hypothetical protein [Agromyces sp. NBRC 114283]GLU88906.1 hypothetical protein Agsp01_11610 [Agromyces sp. NBRC 114283]